jgi:putative PIN family toxin of toxin-antitoxin system
MNRQRVRLVYDTNVIISAVLTPDGDCDQLLQRVVARDVVLVVSPAVLGEYERILTRDSVSRIHQWSPGQIDAFLISISEHAMNVAPGEVLEVIARDPSDNVFVAAAVAARAQFIVSGDKHLLDLGSYQGIQVVRPREMLLILASDTMS